MEVIKDGSFDKHVLYTKFRKKLRLLSYALLTFWNIGPSQKRLKPLKKYSFWQFYYQNFEQLSGKHLAESRCFCLQS